MKNEKFQIRSKIKQIKINRGACPDNTLVVSLNENHIKKMLRIKVLNKIFKMVKNLRQVFTVFADKIEKFLESYYTLLKLVFKTQDSPTLKRLSR